MMRPGVTIAVCVAVLVASIGLAACQEEAEAPPPTQVQTEAEARPTATVPAATPTRVPEATATPAPVEAPELGLARFTSDGKGYRIDHPENWSVKEDALSLGGITADAFVAPLTDDGFGSNVNVLCEPVPLGTDTDEYLERNIDTLRTSLQVEPVVGDSDQVLGQTVRLLTYDLSLGGRDLEITQVLVVSGECGWVLTLTNALGLREKYLPIFRAMYHSFHSE
jgi:hypothetical protein